MAEIDIDIRKMKTIVMKMSSKESVLDESRRSLALLRWKLPEEMTKKQEIDNRISNVLLQIDRIRNMMQDIRSTSNECVMQYLSAETKNVNNIDKFL